MANDMLMAPLETANLQSIDAVFEDHTAADRTKEMSFHTISDFRLLRPESGQESDQGSFDRIPMVTVSISTILHMHVSYRSVEPLELDLITVVGLTFSQRCRCQIGRIRRLVQILDMLTGHRKEIGCRGQARKLRQFKLGPALKLCQKAIKLGQVIGRRWGMIRQDISQDYARIRKKCEFPEVPARGMQTANARCSGT